MIPVIKNFQNKPATLDYGLASIILLLDDLKVKQNSHSFKSSVYRNGSIDFLKPIYKNKCGYCESNTAAGAELRVDHYRPKDKVKEAPAHSGYYWLSYEWSNLVLACEKCNRSKSNKFPLANGGVRIPSPPLITGSTNYNLVQFVITHQNHANELPLIVNPEVDRNLTTWFVFLPSGKVKGLNDKAIKTIEVCKLNRLPLIIERKKLVNSYQRKIRRVLADYRRNDDLNALKIRLKDIFDEIKELQNARNAYSRLGYFIFIKFDVFISSFMKPKSQTLLIKLFNDYRQGIL